MKNIDTTPTIILILSSYLVCAGSSISPAFFINRIAPIVYPIALSQQQLVC